MSKKFNYLFLGGIGYGVLVYMAGIIKVDYSNVNIAFMIGMTIGSILATALVLMLISYLAAQIPNALYWIFKKKSLPGLYFLIWNILSFTAGMLIISVLLNKLYF